MACSKKLFSVMTCGGHRHYGLYSSYVYAFRRHISHSSRAYLVMACGQNKSQGRFKSYAYAFRRHMGHSRLAYPVITCGGNRPQGRYNSYVFVFVPHMCRSRIPLSFIRCGRFLTGVTKAQACGALESVAQSTVRADCFYRTQTPTTHGFRNFSAFTHTW